MPGALLGSTEYTRNTRGSAPQSDSEAWTATEAATNGVEKTVPEALASSGQDVETKEEVCLVRQGPEPAGTSEEVALTQVCLGLHEDGYGP